MLRISGKCNWNNKIIPISQEMLKVKQILSRVLCGHFLQVFGIRVVHGRIELCNPLSILYEENNK